MEDDNASSSGSPVAKPNRSKKKNEKRGKRGRSRSLKKSLLGRGGEKRVRKNLLRKRPLPPAELTIEADSLDLGGILGPLAVTQAAAGWLAVVNDEHRRSFVSHRKKAFDVETLNDWFDSLSTRILWRRPTSDARGTLPRSAAWLTMEGCHCPYQYAGLAFAPIPMQQWFIDITECVCRFCGIRDRPNSCNANYYGDGSQSVGWHSDNEALFDATNQDVLIVSLSLGATRTFEFRPKDNPQQTTRFNLEDGDLCTMEGLCQKHYFHRVPREHDVSGPRINLTWRWVLKHDECCPMNAL